MPEQTAKDEPPRGKRTWWSRWWPQRGAPDAREQQTVQQVWAERAQQRSAPQPVVTAWTDSPIIDRLYINRTISGDPDVNWVTWVVRNFLPRRIEQSLTLGCGHGPLERQGVELDFAARFTAIDVAPGAIEIARRLAAEAGCAARIDYRVADLNTHRLPRAAYGAVFFPQSLHHIEALERLLDDVAAALVPDGILVLNEYVGPTRFQWSARQLAHAQRLLETLPERYRISQRTGKPKLRIAAPTMAQMLVDDPSEAVRSHAILPAVAARFTTIARVDFGGTVLMPLLEDIAGNFDPAQPEDVERLLALCAEEQRLIQSGALPSDFTLLVGKGMGKGRV